MIQRRVGLGLVARRAPGGDAVAAEDHADGLRVRRWARRRCRGRAGTPAGATGPTRPCRRRSSFVSCSPSGAVAMAMPLSGWRWSTWGAVDEAVHGGVDRRRRAAPAVEAEVEGRDHLVLPVLARVHVDERPQPVEAQHGEAGLGQRAEVAAGALDPQQLDVARRWPGRRRCPWPRCCRRRSWCCGDRRRGGWSGRAARGRPSWSRAPPGLVAADPVGDDPLGVAAARGRRPSGRRAGHAPPATRRAPGGRRCRTRPSARRCRPARRPPARPRPARPGRRAAPAPSSPAR